ncbi:MAG: hypothetical protein ACO3RV_06865, partial [Luteolibacter sp.]
NCSLRFWQAPQDAILLPVIESIAFAIGFAAASTTSPSPRYLRALTLRIGVGFVMDLAVLRHRL